MCAVKALTCGFQYNAWRHTELTMLLFFFMSYTLLSKMLIWIQFSSVAQLCPTLCNPMNCSTPGLPVHHQFPEFTQTHVHWVSDAIQSSHPLSTPSSVQVSSLWPWMLTCHWWFAFRGINLRSPCFLQEYLVGLCNFLPEPMTGKPIKAPSSP